MERKSVSGQEHRRRRRLVCQQLRSLSHPRRRLSSGNRSRQPEHPLRRDGIRRHLRNYGWRCPVDLLRHEQQEHSCTDRRSRRRNIRICLRPGLRHLKTSDGGSSWCAINRGLGGDVAVVLTRFHGRKSSSTWCTPTAPSSPAAAAAPAPSCSPRFIELGGHPP